MPAVSEVTGNGLGLGAAALADRMNGRTGSKGNSVCEFLCQTVGATSQSLMKRQLKGKYCRREDGSLNEWFAKLTSQYIGMQALCLMPFLQQGQFLWLDGVVNKVICYPNGSSADMRYLH